MENHPLRREVQQTRAPKYEETPRDSEGMRIWRNYVTDKAKRRQTYEGQRGQKAVNRPDEEKGQNQVSTAKPPKQDSPPPPPPSKRK